MYAGWQHTAIAMPVQQFVIWKPCKSIKAIGSSVSADKSVAVEITSMQLTQLIQSLLYTPRIIAFVIVEQDLELLIPHLLRYQGNVVYVKIKKAQAYGKKVSGLGLL